jgi:hypothetical protein
MQLNVQLLLIVQWMYGVHVQKSNICFGHAPPFIKIQLVLEKKS